MRPFDASGAFHPTADGHGLRRLAVRGAGVTVLSGFFGFGVQTIATIVLARILTPGDFGVVAMVTTFSLLLVNFGFNGFTEAVIQREEIDQFLVSNLFWINLAAGILLTIGFAAAGSLLARLYGDMRVARVAVAVSITIFLTTLSVQHLALLKRSMRFSLVSANDIVAGTVSVVVSIVLGLAGWGYWALVAGVVARALSLSVGAWSLCRWIPSFPRRAAGTMSAVRFALSAYGRFIADYSGNNLDNFLVGWRLGPAPLGFYKKAYDLFVLSANQLSAPLTSVAVAALSRLRRDPIQYRRYLLSAMGLMAFVGMGIGADLTLVGKDLIRMLLGPNWGESGRIFTYFGPGIGVMLVYGMHGWIHLSIGRADRWLRWSLADLTLTAALFLVGIHWGAVGIALAWVTSYWIAVLPALWYAGKPIDFGVAPVLAAVWKYALASLLAGCASAVLIRGLPSLVLMPGWSGAFARAVASSAVFASLYLVAVITLHRGCAPLYQVIRLLREMVPWGKASVPAVATITSATDIGIPTLTGGTR